MVVVVTGAAEEVVVEAATTTEDVPEEAALVWEGSEAEVGGAAVEVVSGAVVADVACTLCTVVVETGAVVAAAEVVALVGGADVDAASLLAAAEVAAEVAALVALVALLAVWRFMTGTNFSRRPRMSLDVSSEGSECCSASRAPCWTSELPYWYELRAWWNLAEARPKVMKQHTSSASSILRPEDIGRRRWSRFLSVFDATGSWWSWESWWSSFLSESLSLKCCFSWSGVGDDIAARASTSLMGRRVEEGIVAAARGRRRLKNDETREWVLECLDGPNKDSVVAEEACRESGTEAQSRHSQAPNKTRAGKQARCQVCGCGCGCRHRTVKQ